MFWKDSGGPDKDLIISSCAEKDILQQQSRKGSFVSRCSQSTAAAAWALMTAWGAGLAAEELLGGWRSGGMLMWAIGVNG